MSTPSLNRRKRNMAYLTCLKRVELEHRKCNITVHVFRDNVVFAGGIKNVICQVLSSKYIFFIIFYNKENILPISILMIFVWKGWWKSDY